MKPEFVTRTTGDFGYDFLVGFRNSWGGVNNIPAEVKTTERFAQNRFTEIDERTKEELCKQLAT